jgi:hypothetical protein
MTLGFKERENLIFDRANALQKELHAFSEDLMSRNKKLTYDVCKDIFYLTKIAELQLENQILKNNNTILGAQ